MKDKARFVGAVSVLVFRDDRVLAMRRSPLRAVAPGAWDAVSGTVRVGEQPFDTAVRETREETGLTVVVDPRPVSAYQAKLGSGDMLAVAYRGESPTGDVVLSDEHDSYAWMEVEEFARACRFPSLVEAARLAARSRSRRRSAGHPRS